MIEIIIFLQLQNLLKTEILKTMIFHGDRKLRSMQKRESSIRYSISIDVHTYLTDSFHL